jgi:hypothetical protein
VAAKRAPPGSESGRVKAAGDAGGLQLLLGRRV